MSFGLYFGQNRLGFARNFSDFIKSILSLIGHGEGQFWAHFDRPWQWIQGMMASKFRSFLKATKGAVAVEFALVALPFLFLLMGILQIGLIFFVQTDLDNASAEARRLIRTGEFQATYSSTGTGAASAFETLICNNATSIPNCANNLAVDVSVAADYNNITYANRITGGSFNDALTSIDTGSGGDIVVVTISYKWPLFVPLVDQIFASTNNGERVLVSTIVFRNEPFPW
mgnify:CR=1 FL=1